MLGGGPCPVDGVGEVLAAHACATTQLDDARDALADAEGAVRVAEAKVTDYSGDATRATWQRVAAAKDVERARRVLARRTAAVSTRERELEDAAAVVHHADGGRDGRHLVVGFAQGAPRLRVVRGDRRLDGLAVRAGHPRDCPDERRAGPGGQDDGAAIGQRREVGHVHVAFAAGLLGDRALPRPVDVEDESRS
ncbi:hypothetical protein [Cellulosimicrobium cellulans]|uniref:Uncharacterized protein n=1 Tax=Cellulosimicrobium cellulans TaxID=1710 RepID=A0A4Y4E350_CELCE|nr:hypothetical protein CCE02nite_20190 [Cellulosimicrobium cellulans]